MFIRTSKYGDDAQRAQWLPGLLNASLKGAYCITEAGAGSDVSGIKTTATRTADGWVLNGSKLWIHNAPVADVAFVLARTDKDAGHRGMSIFIVDCSRDGVSRGPKEHKMGQRSSQVGELHFNQVRLPAQALLGPENRGFHIMMSVLNKGRVGIGALAVGIARAGLEAAIAYAKQREQFGKHVGVQRIAERLPVGKEFIERPGFEQGSGKNMCANFSPFFNHANAQLTLLLLRHLHQPAGCR